MSVDPGMPNSAPEVALSFWGAVTAPSGGFSGGMDWGASVMDEAVGASGGLSAALAVGKGEVFGCKAAMAAFKSAGHTDACICNGAYASKVRHISIICCGGSKPR